MANFTNSRTRESSKTIRGGKEIDPTRLEQLIKDFNKLDKNFFDLKENINDFKDETKDTIKSQETWITAGFIALVFIVVGLLVAVGAITNDYFLMKQATYQSLRDKVEETNLKIDTLIKK